MNHRLSLSLTLLLLLLAATNANAVDGKPAADVPQLAVLQRLVGTFETTYESPVKTTGESKSDWTHGGRFIRTTWSRKAAGDSPAIDGTMVVTYDVANQKYRQWSFDSTGTIMESTGAWDAKSRTMTWTGESAGLSHTWKQTFDKSGAYDWSIVLKVVDGTVVYRTNGKSKPKKAD